MIEMEFLEGRQELLILLLDVSGSMYCVEAPGGETILVNKYSQVQSAIIALLKKIDVSNKQNNIVISVVPFSSNSAVLKLNGSNANFYPTQTWLEGNRIQSLFDEVNDFGNGRRQTLGNLTSFVNAFKQASKVSTSFFKDTRIAPENRHGISIMLFSDGQNCPESDSLLSDIGDIIEEIKLDIKSNIADVKKRDNFSINCVAIGEDADEITLKTISSPYTQKQEKHISDLRKIDANVSMSVDEYRCYLRLNAANDSISEYELNILRKFMFLVTDTQ